MTTLDTEIETFKMKGRPIKMLKVAPEHQKRVFSPNTVSSGIGEYFIDDFVTQRHKPTIIGLGSGSGIMEIAYALFGAKYVFGSEKNKEAVDYAWENAGLNGVEDRVEFCVGDMYEPLGNLRADGIVHDAGSMIKKIAMLTPWYNEEIDCGGEEGTETSVKAVDGADSHLNRKGVFYFPRISLAHFNKIRDYAESKFSGRIIDLNNKIFPMRIRFHDCLLDQEKLKQGIKEPHEVLKNYLDQGMIFYEELKRRWFWYLHMQKAFAQAS